MILDTLIFAIALNFMWLALHIMDGFTIKRLDTANELLRTENHGLRVDARQSRYLQDWIEQKPFREHWAEDAIDNAKKTWIPKIIAENNSTSNYDRKNALLRRAE